MLPCPQIEEPDPDQIERAHALLKATRNHGKRTGHLERTRNTAPLKCTLAEEIDDTGTKITGIDIRRLVYWDSCVVWGYLLNNSASRTDDQHPVQMDSPFPNNIFHFIYNRWHILHPSGKEYSHT